MESAWLYRPTSWDRRERVLGHAGLSGAAKAAPFFVRIRLRLRTYFPKITVLEKWELAAM